MRSRAVGIITGLFGAVWLLNAAFQAQAWLFAPDAAANLLRAFGKPAREAPPWLEPVLIGVVHGVQAVGPGAVAGAMVAIAVVLGLSLLMHRALAIVAAGGLLYSLVCWVALEALGFPYAHGQTDPGVFVAYAIAFLFVLGAAAGAGAGAAPDRRARFRDSSWRAARLSFGLLWAFDAGLKWLPAFLFHFTRQITSVIPGQPYWIAEWLHLVVLVVGALGPVAVAVIVALVETAIALGLLSGRGLRFVLPLGILYALAVWSTAEAFGGPYTAAGTGVRGNVVGNVIVYVIPFLFLSAAHFTRAPLPDRSGRGASIRAAGEVFTAAHCKAEPSR